MSGSVFLGLGQRLLEYPWWQGSRARAGVSTEEHWQWWYDRGC